MTDVPIKPISGVEATGEVDRVQSPASEGFSETLQEALKMLRASGAGVKQETHEYLLELQVLAGLRLGAVRRLRHIPRRSERTESLAPLRVTYSANALSARRSLARIPRDALDRHHARRACGPVHRALGPPVHGRW